MLGTYILADDILTIGGGTYIVTEVDEIAGALYVQPSGEDYVETLDIATAERRIAAGRWDWTRQAPLFDLAQFIAA